MSQETSTQATTPSAVAPASSAVTGSDPVNQQQLAPVDCMPCKLVGCAGFGGLGIYSFYQAKQIPSNLVARRFGLGLMGTVFIGAAVYRLSMPMYKIPSSTSKESK